MTNTTVKRISKQTEMPFYETLVAKGMDLDPDFPRFLAGIPIFHPTSNRKAMDNLDFDEDSKFTYSIPAGTITRIGPGLNAFDQSTLIALFHIGKQKRFTGIGNTFPIPTGSDSVESVYSGFTNATQLNRWLGRDLSGGELKRTRNSVRRLWISKLLYWNRETDIECEVKFFEYIGQKDIKGDFYIQFPPVMVHFFTDVIEIDMELRDRLSDTGKCLQVYLQSVDRAVAFEMTIKDLAEAIGHTGRLTDLKAALIGKKDRLGILGIMKEFGFITSYEALGGRGKAAIRVVF